MKNLRLLLSIVLASYMAGVGNFVSAQETGVSSLSMTLAPIQYAHVKGNVDKFKAVNWMPNGYEGGISNISFLKQINKSVSLEVSGSLFPNTQNYDDELILRNGDLAFLKINYKSFRKYFDGTGGIDTDFFNTSDGTSSGTGSQTPVGLNAMKPNSPHLQMDISYLKLETGIGPILDPFLDLVYEHDYKSGYKSLLSWAPVYNTFTTARSRYIAPSWGAINDTTERLTLKEKKDIVGITIKGEQRLEVDYNHNKVYMPAVFEAPPSQITHSLGQRVQEDYPDTKLFGSGVRFEKWMLGDKTFAALGYHFNHVRSTDLFQNIETDYAGDIINTSTHAHQSLWSDASVMEDEHVWVGNFNTNLTHDLAFVTDTKYEHIGSAGSSIYLDTSLPAFSAPGSANATYQFMNNHRDHTGEHVAIRYAGLPHTSLYVESNLEQERNWFSQSWADTNTPANNFLIERIARLQKTSWDIGAKIVPNKFFIFTTQFKQHWNDTKYDTVNQVNPTKQTFLDQLKTNGNEVATTLTWKPYRWLRHSLRYQFLDTDYNPRAAAEGSGLGSYDIAKNNMVSSVYTYEVTMEPIDPLMLLLSYSHVESYVRTLAASQPGAASGGHNYIPDFNSGNNSWLFSASYTPWETLTFTNSAGYIISNNFVDFSDGVPYGSSFKELDLSAGLEWTYHKWIKMGPSYRFSSYRGNPLIDAGTYSAHIFELKMGFHW